jgi:hypothetical protein
MDCPIDAGGVVIEQTFRLDCMACGWIPQGQGATAGRGSESLVLHGAVPAVDEFCGMSPAVDKGEGEGRFTRRII